MLLLLLVGQAGKMLATKRLCSPVCRLADSNLDSAKLTRHFLGRDSHISSLWISYPSEEAEWLTSDPLGSGQCFHSHFVFLGIVTAEQLSRVSPLNGLCMGQQKSLRRS